MDKHISKDKKLIASSELLKQKVDGEYVLVNLENQNYYALDLVGSRIWEILLESESTYAAFDQVLAEYEVEGDRLQSDLDQLISDLLASGLVTLELV